MPTSVRPPLPPAGAFVKSPEAAPVVEPPPPPVPVVPDVPPGLPVAPVVPSPVVPPVASPPVLLPPPPWERAAVRCAEVSRAPHAVVAIAPSARTAARRRATGLREGIAGGPSER